MTDRRLVAVECGSCETTVSAEVHGSVYVADADWLVQLAECPACAAPVLVGRSAESYGDDWDLGTPARPWPSPPRTLSVQTPRHIARDFDEAQVCLRNRAFTAAALMARRVLEAIAAELGANERTLGGKLNELRSNGVLDERLLQWARALQVVGNEAAHAVGADISKEDATDVLAFAEAMADYSFTFRRQYEQLIQRRGL